MKVKHVLPGVAMAAVFLFSGCGGDAPKSTGYDYERSDSLDTRYTGELSTIKSTIESSAALFEGLNGAGRSFNQSAMLSNGKASSLSGSKSQALGLGAFGSDMVYATSFGQTQVSRDYLSAISSLAGNLGISSAFKTEIMEKLSSDDTTQNKRLLLTSAFIEAKRHLQNEERAKLATLMAVGGWVEAMHLSSDMMASEMGDDEARQKYWELADSYNSIMKMCEVFEAEADVKEVMEALEGIRAPMKAVYKNNNKYTPENVTAVKTAIDDLRGKLM